MLKSKEKILFIIPPYLPFDEYHPKKAGIKIPTLTPPYGVLSIISYINQNNEYDIEIFDMNEILIDYKGNTHKELLISYINNKINSFKYICISALFNTCFPHLKYICKRIKEVHPLSILLIGGGLATNLYKDLVCEIPEIDALCYGEGEIPFKKLLNNKKSPAWITKESLEAGIMPEYEFIEDLDDIPIVDFSYIPLKKYNGRSYIDKNLDDGKIEVSIHTSRGCPFNCCFCSNGTVHGKKVRKMSEERVLDTIQWYIDDYNMDILMIEDDHFLSNKKRALFLLDKIKKFNISVEFPNGLAVYQIDEDIAKALSECNVKVIPLAIESGSEHVLKNIIKKPLKKEQIFKAVNILRKYDIKLHAFVIIGFPGELDKHREETLELLINLDIDWVHVFIVVPIAGSRLYAQCEKEGYLLTKDYNQYTISKCNIKAPGIDPEAIEKYAYYMNIKVNYLENSNFKAGNYDACTPYFKNVVNHYPDNAIAHYMLYKIYMEISCLISAGYHYIKFRKRNDFYKNLVEQFKKEGYIFDE
jgi:radical SAM superfamily enzyme YgiQ (UPF0313 family)